MIEGEVASGRVIELPIRILSRRGEYFDEMAVLDTAFSGHMTLPPDKIATMELDFVEEREHLVEGDQQVTFRVYQTLAIWDDIEREVLVVALKGLPTIGTGLLYGYDLRARWVDGGAVRLSRIPPD